jgi:hypothetical protein
MSWAIGGPDARGRWVGYGVPAYCDAPGCQAEIDRGLSCVCGGEPYGGEHGCGLYFCAQHLFTKWTGRRLDCEATNLCGRCVRRRPPYKRISIEHPTWVNHLLTDESWERWRQENPKVVAKLTAAYRWYASPTVSPPPSSGGG